MDVAVFGRLPGALVGGLPSTTACLRVLATVLLVCTVIAAAGCAGRAGGDSAHQLDEVSERLVTSALALRIPEPAAPVEPGPAPRRAGASMTIGATGGTGVALRSDCLDTARSGGGWADAVTVVVAEYGTDKCAGWIRVTLGATTSWVRDDYLIESGTAPPAAGGATPSQSDGGLRIAMDTLSENAWRVAALMRSNPGNGDGLMAAVYLGMAATSARTLASQVEAAAPSIPANCAAARGRLVTAAGALETLASAGKRFFEAPGPDGVSAVERAAEMSISAQTALTSATGGCLTA